LLVLRSQVDAGPVIQTTSTLRVAELVRLFGADTEPAVVAPGTTGPAHLRVGNDGAIPVRGAILVLDDWSAVLGAERYRNCVYGDRAVVCTFDDVLAPSAGYELSPPIGVRIPRGAAAGSQLDLFGVWVTPDDWKDVRHNWPDERYDGVPGTGAATHLVARAAADAVPQTDPSGGGRLFTQLVVGGSRGPDMAAIGAAVTGAPGDRVAVRVGFVNRGPGALFHSLFDNTDPATHVVVPPGLRAVEVDDRCRPTAMPDDDESDDVAGAPDYTCIVDADRTAAGATVLFDFTFAIGGRAGAAGYLRLNQPDLITGARIDTRSGDDTAAIKVVFPDARAELPITGTHPRPVAAAGLLLILIGLAGRRLATRPR
jgi:hypothetical protein